MLRIGESSTHSKDIFHEKIYNIKQDVDIIYNKCFKQFMKDFKDKKISSGYMLLKYFPDISTGNFRIKFNVNLLKSVECKEALLLNPVSIYCGVYDSGAYIPKYNSDKGEINLSLSKDTIIKIIDSKFDYVSLKKSINKSEFNFLLNDISESRLKANIYHELSHWLNDSLHSLFLTKLVALTLETDNLELTKLEKTHIDLAHFELDAQIHGIQAIKNKYSKKWDTLTFQDVVSLYTSLRVVGHNVLQSGGTGALNIWQKHLLKRMSREGLLGKNMKKLVGVDYFKNYKGV